MGKQFQHIVPQVYLKGFGFQKPNFGNKWFVSVKDIKKKGWHDREIQKFLGDYNIYDLSTVNTISNRIIEENLHGSIENRIPYIIDYLDKASIVHPAIHLDIAETVANFLCRSRIVLNWIDGILDRNPYGFWSMITEHTKIITSEEQSDEVFAKLMCMPAKDRRNNLMVFFMLHIKLLLSNANLTVFRNTTDYYLFTNDNPVQIRNVGLGEIVKSDFELYFALTKNYLIYFYWKNTICEVESVRPSLKNDVILDMPEELARFFCEKVVSDIVERFIISPLDKALLGH